MEQIRISEVKEFKPEYTLIVYRLLCQLASSSVQFSDADLQDIISSESNHLFLLFYADDVAGMLSIGSYRTPIGKKYWIEDVVVDEKYRGKGFGRFLMEYAIKFVEALGVSSLMLTSNPTRVAANKLYQSVGFEQKLTNVYKMEFPAEGE